ncbi:MAG: hypothetical protein HWE13_08820 [Gammaproteobacteria bacterium]|nr:hypothetical protein [Gammaproteobacteria bacterium]
MRPILNQALLGGLLLLATQCLANDKSVKPAAAEKQTNKGKKPVPSLQLLQYLAEFSNDEGAVIDPRTLRVIAKPKRKLSEQCGVKTAPEAQKETDKKNTVDSSSCLKADRTLSDSTQPDPKQQQGGGQYE